MKKLINLNFTGATRGIPLMKQYRNLFIILTVALFLTACGGGGGTSLSLESPTQASGGGTGNGSGGNGNGGGGNGGTGNGGGAGNGGTSSGPITISDDPLMDAEEAQMAAEMARTLAYETHAASPIGAFQTKTTITSAMGVSANIGADQAAQAMSTIEDEIAKISRQRDIAEQAVMTLEAEAMRLREEADELQIQLDAAIEKEPMLLAEWNDLDASVTHIENEINTIDTEIMSIEGEADSAEKGTCGTGCPGRLPNLELAAELRQRVEDIRTGMTKLMYQLPDDDAKEMEYTYAELKALAESLRMTADEKYMELDTIQKEITDLTPKPSEKENEAMEKGNEVEEAKDHVQEIDDILVEFEGNEEATEEERTVSCPVRGYSCRSDGTRVLTKEGVLKEWREALPEDAAADESEKAKLVLQLLISRTLNAHSDVISDLDTADYVFARADKPAAGMTMTFEDIARGGAWGSAGGIFHTRSIVRSDGGTPLDTSDDVIDTSFVPANHPVIALSSLKAANFDPQGNDTTPSDRAYLEYHHGQLNGIEGTLYCDRAGGCITGGNGYFGEGWYFTPAVTSGREGSLGYNPAEVSFEDSDGDGTYELASSSYVDYGMWLEGADDALTLHRRVGVVGPSVSLNFLDILVYDPDRGNTTSGTDLRATYTGEARGLSARNTGTAFASGHFVADVELEARFGPTPPPATVGPDLGGKIDNFRAVAGQGSDHVDPGWSIELNRTSIYSKEFTGGLILDKNSVQTGNWSATAYGDTRGERPDGFYGGFNTYFLKEGTTNVAVGAAVGVYSAEK